MTAIPSCIHCLLGSKPGTEVQRSGIFVLVREQVHRQIILAESNVYYNRSGEQSPRAWESKVSHLGQSGKASWRW